MVLEEGKDATKKGSKKLDCENKNKQSEKLASEIYNLYFSLKEIANELTNRDLYDELSTLTEKLKTAVELQVSLLFLVIVGGIKLSKVFIDGSVADQIIETGTFIETNADNHSLEDEANDALTDSQEETKTVLSGQKIVQREQTNEADTASRETKCFKRFDSYRKNSKLMIELGSAFTHQLQNIASLGEQQRKAFQLTPSLILSCVGTDDSECRIEESEERLDVTEDVSEQKVTRIEQNTDEDQQFPEENEENMRGPQERKSTYLLVSAIRSRLRALLRFCKDSRVVPVVKALNLINDTYKCPEFEQLKVSLWKLEEVLQCFIQKKDIRAQQPKIEGEKGFILSEIDSNDREEKRNATDTCKG